MALIHTPHRPSWLCRGCGGDFPCLPFRVDALTEYERDTASLRVFMASFLLDAREDLPDAPSEDLWFRFMVWIDR